ncbi:hypothetical protein [Micromonospora maritima]|uniref:hypothetical protein n=1 Tax=Micromonospora maritima TaxID=986711 RepID=UPI00157CF1AA|nr:hypothetical protein [Micromonospora maritima]
MSEAIERVQVLHGHTGEESAYLVEDYPYGFRLRCQIRYWIETAEKGAKKGQQRLMSQTTNPKKPGEPWNKPKGSTYVLMAVMYLDGEGHVQWTGVSEYGLTPVHDARWRLWGVVDQLDDEQRRLYDLLLKASQRSARQWEEWEERVSRVADHIRETGQEPELVNGIWKLPTGGTLYMLDAMPEIVAYARQRLDG